MKNKLTLVLLCAISLTISCKKPLREEPYPCPPLIMLTKVTGTSRLDGDGSLKTVNMVFSYNQSNLLVKIKDGKKGIDISYTDVAYLTNVLYSDSSAAVAKRRLLEVLVLRPFNQPLKEQESIYEGDQLVSKSILDYTYTDELVTKVERTRNNQLVSEQRYTYKNGNMITHDDGAGKIYKYEYGVNRNPFNDIALKFRPGTMDFTSINEPTAVEEIQNGSTKKITNTYTYNTEGYPLTLKSIDSNGVLVVDYKFEYGTFPVGCY